MFLFLFLVQVLQAIAHELGSLIELVGGAAYCAVLLGPLEKLAQVEEVVVRDRAVESITYVAEVRRESWWFLFSNFSSFFFFFFVPP